MTRRYLRAAIGVTTTVVTAGIAITMAANPAQADTIDITLQDAIEALPVEDEVRDGYDRDLFPLWSDEDGDGCNTRNEVLIAEAVEAPTTGSSCRLTGGRWYSYYDGEEWTQTGDLDIDHLVPLAESWDSGSRDWSTDDRERYANDLGDDRDLVAVTDNVNQSKSDQDPAEWMPPLEDVACQYIEEWTVVKTRWRLSVDQAEKDALTEIAANCQNTSLTIEYAI